MFYMSFLIRKIQTETNCVIINLNLYNIPLYRFKALCQVLFVEMAFYE